MTAYYLDTSALVKRYVDEAGSAWLRAKLNEQPAPSVAIVHLALVELTSAFTRRLREGVLTPDEYAQAQSAFRSDCLHDYELITAVGNIIDRANQLLETHPLRAYDAIHLAAAVAVNSQLLATGLASLVFTSADDRLNRAAAAEGLAVDNPNHHP